MLGWVLYLLCQTRFGIPAVLQSRPAWKAAGCFNQKVLETVHSSFFIAPSTSRKLGKTPLEGIQLSGDCWAGYDYGRFLLIWSDHLFFLISLFYPTTIISTQNHILLCLRVFKVVFGNTGIVSCFIAIKRIPPSWFRRLSQQMEAMVELNSKKVSGILQLYCHDLLA